MMQLFAVLTFFAIGFFCIYLPFSLSLRLRFVHHLLMDTSPLVWIGLGFFSLTLLLIIGFYASSTGRYLLLTMGKPVTEVDVKVLKKTIEPLLTKYFASRVRLTDIEVFKKHHLRIGLFLSMTEEKEREKILSDAEHHLQTILAERFGYQHPFTVQVNEH
jgi:hypothetical protein